jgi:hypothetical protein
VWNGVVFVAVAATDGGPITTTCEIRVNDVAQPPVLTASGTGNASSAGQLTFTAASTDIVSICTHVLTSTVV